MVQINLLKEFEQINDISEELNTLKIIINYASTTLINSDASIISFVDKIYPSNQSHQSHQSAKKRIMKSKILENCQLKHLKHIWLLLNIKRSMLYTINNQDPFETLSNAFKKPTKPIRLKVNMDSSMILSVLSVVYQVITIYLHSFNEELEGFEDKKISDYFQYMSSLDIMVSENIEKLPYTFPDDEEELNLNGEAYLMRDIYEMWKHLCFLMTKA